MNGAALPLRRWRAKSAQKGESGTREGAAYIFFSS